MKKVDLLLLTASLLLLGSCNKEEATQEPVAQGFAPKISATAEQGMVTKAGVIEGNANYATIGEQFYWSVGDAATVFFDTEQLNYTVSSVRAQRNQAAFSTTDNLSGPGVYNIYGYFPASAWVFSPILAAIPAEQIQPDNTSKHLSNYMLMKAQSLGATITSENSISLNYKHLSSVLRVAVWNNSSNGNLKLTNINVSSSKAVFGAVGQLINQGAASLEIISTTKTSNIGLSLTGSGRDFSLKDGKQQCEGYLAVMPTAADAFAATDNLVVALSLTDGTNNYVINKIFNVANDLAFLTAGIQQGKSYYLRLKVANADLIPVIGTSYAVGNYYPNAASPVGVVFWIKPGTFGTHGKVVGFGEFHAPKWGTNVDEQAAGVTGIRSFDDGLVATKNLITKYKDASLSTDYPMFNHIYQVANAGSINGVWYLPAKNELKMLYAGYSGKVYENILRWLDGLMPGYNEQSAIDARAAFNAKLTSKGGTAFASDLHSWYWSSSELSNVAAKSINLDEGNASSDPKNLDGYVRWIRNF